MQLDCTEPIQITEELASKETNLLRTARHLATGLGFLYGKVRVAELTVLDQFSEDTREQMKWFSWGNDPAFAGIRLDLIECAFHWYAVSACNFVRVISALGFGRDKELRRRYESAVLHDIRPFRDKLGAHIAGVTCNEKDNDAERLVSIITAIAWSTNRFEGAPLTVRMTKGNEKRDSSAISPWSLTARHEEFATRYPMIQASMPLIERRPP